MTKTKFGEYVLDVESDGPCPGLYNMISFGLVNRHTKTSFLGLVAPDVDNNGGNKEARSVSGISFKEQKSYNSPKSTMSEMLSWIETDSENANRIAIYSDNPAFDWQFFNYYCIKYIGHNPAGHSARRIGDLYAGVTGEFYNTNKWKKLYRKTKHTHNPVDDAMGNAEALDAIQNLMKDVI